MTRKTLFQIIEPHQKENAIEKSYDVLMFLTIIVSLIPLTTKSHTGIFMWLDFVSTIIFVMDYVLRLVTADYKLGKGKLSFFLYPFTFLALADLLCILPSLFLLNNSLRLFKILRMLRILRVFWLLAIFSFLPLSFLMSSPAHFLIFWRPLLGNHLPDDGWLWWYLCSFNDWKNYYHDFFLFRNCYCGSACWYHHGRLYERN